MTFARVLGVGLEILVNVVLPFLIYNYGEKPWGQVPAMLASSAPPIAWSVIEFARRRRVDALSLLVLAGIALSLLAFLGGGGIRFLQLREKLVTFGIGLLFLGSAAIGKPLFAYLMRAGFQRGGAASLAQFETISRSPQFHRTVTLLTVVWGAGLVAEAALAGVLVFVLTVRQYLIVAPIMGYVVFSSLGLWTFLFGRGQRRKGEARRAAEAARLNQGR